LPKEPAGHSFSSGSKLLLHPLQQLLLHLLLSSSDMLLLGRQLLKLGSLLLGLLLDSHSDLLLLCWVRRCRLLLHLLDLLL
jgi:hypothetical protein